MLKCLNKVLIGAPAMELRPAQLCIRAASATLSVMANKPPSRTKYPFDFTEPLTRPCFIRTGRPNL